MSQNSTVESGVPRRAGLVLASLILGAFVCNLNLSVANVALPDIGKAFDASQTALDAALMSARVDAEALEEHENAAVLARDYLIGGDTCFELLEVGTKNLKLLPMGQELSTWWQVFLLQKKSVSMQQG